MLRYRPEMLSTAVTDDTAPFVSNLRAVLDTVWMRDIARLPIIQPRIIQTFVAKGPGR